MPADQIGHFLDLCLRNRDNYVAYRLTMMVLDCETYSNIALYMLQYLGICDEDHNPLWTELGPGDGDRRPLQKGHDGYEECMKRCTIDGRTIEWEETRHIPVNAPQPVPVIAPPRPVRHLRLRTIWFTLEDSLSS